MLQTKTGTTVLCKPAQSKRKWTSHAHDGKWKRPNYHNFGSTFAESSCHWLLSSPTRPLTPCFSEFGTRTVPFIHAHVFSLLCIWPQRFEPGAVLWFGFMFIALHITTLWICCLFFLGAKKKMMSLTALSVCRGTPRLKFHGMKISARLFSLSPHLVLVYRGTYFLQMFVFFLGPSSRKKQCSDQPQRIPFFILAGTWMPPSYENIIAPPWFRFAKC